MAIRFHEENTKKQNIYKKVVREWIQEEILRRRKVPGEINIIFTSDIYLRNLNMEYLKREYYTDIISFDYSDKLKISGDLFISTDRVKENAVSYNVNYDQELLRVIIHGILHFLGYKDDNKEDKDIMHTEENACIKNFEKIMEKKIK